MFVQTLRVEFAPVETGDLRADQGGAAFEIVRAVAGPFEKSLVMPGHLREKLVSLLLGCRIGDRGPGQRRVKVIFRFEEVGAWPSTETVAHLAAMAAARSYSAA